MRLGLLFSSLVFVIATTKPLVSQAQAPTRVPVTTAAAATLAVTPPLVPPSTTALVWTNPTQVLLVPTTPSLNPPRLLDGTLPISLLPHAVLLVPVSPGDWVEVMATNAAQLLQLGLAGGTKSAADWLLWQVGLNDRIRVPSFTTAKYVAIRSVAPTTVRIKQSTILEEPLDWFELDARVARWLFSNGPKPLGARDLGRTLTSLSQAGDLLEEVDGVRASLPPTMSSGTRHLLFAYWLEESLRIRPIVTPFFKRADGIDARQPRVLTAPAVLTVRDSGDLYRLRVRGFGDTTIAVFEGTGLARQVRFRQAVDTKARWSDERRLRVVPGSRRCIANPLRTPANALTDPPTIVPPCDQDVRLQVLQGSVSITSEAFAARDEYRTIFGRFSRSTREHWTYAASDQTSWVRDLARAKLGLPEALPFEPSTLVASVRRTNPKSEPVVLAFLDYQASRLAETLPRATAFAFLALRRSRSNYQRAAAATRLIDLGLDDEGRLEREALHKDITADERTTAPPFLFDGNSLESLLVPARRGLRPEAGLKLENWAAAQIGNSDAPRIAAAYWKAFDYRTVAPDLGNVTTQRQQPVTETGQCSQAPDDATQWLIADRTPVSFDVTLSDGLYALSNLLPLSETPVPEGYVTLDELAIPVHSGAGLPSRVALANGTHRLTRSNDGPAVALEMTAGMTAPCASLQRKQVWVKLESEQPTQFALPSPGASSVVRVRVESQTPNAKVTIVLNSRRLVLELRDAGTQSAEFLAAPTDDSLTLTTQDTLVAQVSMRRQADPELEPARLNAGSSLPLTNASTIQSGSINDFEALKVQAKLPELRRLSAALHTAKTDTERSHLQEQRGAMLLELGYRQFSLRDSVALPTSEDNRDFAYFVGTKARTIPLGLLSQLPPLPLASSIEQLRLRKKQRQLAGNIACSQDISDELIGRGDAESLLAAYCAERSAQPAVAARLYETIARKTGQGHAYLRAAGLSADTAIDKQNLGPTLQTAILATHAAAQGTDASDLWARLGSAISWAAVSVLDGAAGYVSLTSFGRSERTPKQLVIAALSVAPEASLLIEPNERAELLLDNQRRQPLVVEQGCDDSRGEPCLFQTLVDGIAMPSRTMRNDGRYEVSVPVGRHRVEFGFVGDTPLGWVKIGQGDTSLVPQLLTRWHELEPNQPASLTVKGPTILRLRFRARGPRSGVSTAKRVQLAGCGILPALGRFELPATTDLTVRPWPFDDATQIGTERLVDLPIESASRCSLSLLTLQPGALVQVSLARANALPKPRLEPSLMPFQLATKAVYRSFELETDLAPAIPREQPTGSPLFLGLRTRLSSESLSAITEQDTAVSNAKLQDVFAETSVILARELVEGQLWGTAQVGTRLREGPLTKLARLSVDLPPQPGLPGVELQVNTYAQTFAQNSYNALSSTARISTLFVANASQSVAPQLSYTSIRVPQRPVGNGPVDRDVYSRYLAEHSRYGTADVAYKLRPFIDAMTTVGVSVRSLPNFDGFDRVTATTDLWFLPYNDWPLLLSAGWLSSIRPENELRAHYFVRHQFDFGFSLWKWVTGRERVRLFGQLGCFFDAPAATSLTLVVAPTLAVEITTSGRRGLRDQSPQQVPFRSFQERGSARVHPSRTGPSRALPVGSTP